MSNTDDALIVVEPCYYQGTCNAPKMGAVTAYDVQSWILRDTWDDDLLEELEPYSGYDDSLPCWFERSTAEKVVEVLDSEVYYLSHGEAGRPDYKIVSDPAELYTYPKIDAGYFGSDAVEISEDDLPEGIAPHEGGCEYDFDYGDAHYVYTYSQNYIGPDEVEWRYIAAWTVPTLEAQMSEGDLDSVCWDNYQLFKVEA